MVKGRMVIGVSKLSPNYAGWLRKLHDALEILDFYTLPVEEVTKHLSGVAGILLTGGGDIHPDRYGRNEDLALCRGIDTKRDELEAMIIADAFTYNIPLLGICRGQQMLNVVRNGTLFTDISTFTDAEIIHSGEKDVDHPVNILQESLLFKLTGLSNGMVNSAHHQAINSIAPGFIASAFSPDGLVEAIETDSKSAHPFCIAVQWHPERMNGDNPLSGLLGKGFVEAALNHATAGS